MRVLIVEDHRDLAESVARGLRRHAMAVELAHDGEQGLARASSGAYDVVVLDRDLPLVHGDAICRAYPPHRRPGRLLSGRARRPTAPDGGAREPLIRPAGLPLGSTGRGPPFGR